MKALVDRNKLRTHVSQPKQLQRHWYLVDAQGKILGRLATEIAGRLSGRGKVSWSPQIDVGDHVVVINTPGVKLTGQKADSKTYYKHTRYLGHLRATPYRRMAERRPNEVVRHAVLGMLPRNRSRASMMRRLHLYAAAEHPHADKFKS